MLMKNDQNRLAYTILLNKSAMSNSSKHRFANLHKPWTKDNNSGNGRKKLKMYYSNTINKLTKTKESAICSKNKQKKQKIVHFEKM